MVWIPKCRRRILVGQVAERLKQTVEQSAAEREWDMVALEVTPGHVHLSVASPPSVRPYDLVKVFKGVSARILLKEFLGLA
jgi:putative transposase